MLPCLIFEDEHLLAVNKPAGLNTHAPNPYAGEGLYDWLRHREPRWASLAIIHRLDKETSGIIVFAKTPLANRSLTRQFTRRTVRKQYLLLTDRPVPEGELVVRSALVRAGDKYVSRPRHAAGEPAETRFLKVHSPKPVEVRTPRPPVPDNEKHADEASALLWRGGAAPRHPGGGSYCAVTAEPRTGRTHQIRVHAAEQGFPILGDTLYGGTPAARVYLHAAQITLEHPATGQEVTFRAPAAFEANPRLALRAALLDSDATNAFRLVHGASDGWPGWYAERLGDYLLSESEQPLNPGQQEELQHLLNTFSGLGACHKLLTRRVCKTSPASASPQLVLGQTAPERFVIRENGLQFDLSFNEGYSVGLFLDQRDNRRRLLTGHVAAGFPLFHASAENQKPEVLNTFAYTCAFSVGAAKAGARATSLDLSKKYLEWGRRNFLLNQLDPVEHDFVYGDVFDWLRRFGRKQRRFDVILLDPPTFSQSKESGVFQAQKDYSRLVAAALPLLKADGVLFASTNAADWPPEEFLAAVQAPLQAAGRKILQQHYVPQPPDFPISRAQPAYLKTVWLRLE